MYIYTKFWCWYVGLDDILNKHYSSCRHCVSTISRTVRDVRRENIKVLEHCRKQKCLSYFNMASGWFVLECVLVVVVVKRSPIPWQGRCPLAYCKSPLTSSPHHLLSTQPNPATGTERGKQVLDALAHVFIRMIEISWNCDDVHSNT